MIKRKNFMFENSDSDFEIYNTIVIDITKLRQDAEELDVNMDCNLLRDILLEADEDVHINGSSVVNPDGTKQIYMTVYNLTNDYAATIINGFIHDTLADNDLDYCDFNDAKYYFVDDNNTGNNDLNDFNLNESFDNQDDFPPYEDDEQLPYDEQEDDFPPYEDDNSDLDDEKNYTDDLNIRKKCEKAINIYIRDLKANGVYLALELDDETAEDIANCFISNSSDDRDYVIELLKDIYANNVEQSDDLNEKRKGCCPPKKIISTVISEPEETEGFESVSESVKMVFDDIDKNAKLTNKVKKALINNKRCLHENVKVAGKYFKDMSILELESIKNAILCDKKRLTETLSNSLNESAAYNQIKREINLKNMILNYVEEELTYRNTRYDCIRKLNEDGRISDDELADLFGPAQGEESDNDKDAKKNDDKSKDKDVEEKDTKDNDSEEKDTKDNDSEEIAEEIELARIEITLKTPEACIDLKKACLDADIPEDAIELEGVDDSAFEEDKEESEEENKEEESEEENKEEEAEEENKEENANESVHYKNIARLFEADEENTEENNNNEEDDKEDDKEEDEEKSNEYKFILVNTDYTKELVTVLNDLYGINNEEFEEMIGGAIVSEEEDSDDDSKEKEEKEDDKEEDEEKENKEKDDDKKSDDDDDIDPAELFKGL